MSRVDSPIASVPAVSHGSIFRQAFYFLLGILGLLLVLAIIFRWYQIGHLNDPRWQLILTVLGLTVGAWLLHVQSFASGRFRKTAAVSAAAIVFSQVCYLILVWTTWKMDTLVWRLWWLSVVPATTATHILWLRLSAAPDRRATMRLTVVCALLSGALLASLALRRQLLGNTAALYPWLLGIFSGLSALGTLVLWLRGIRLAGRKVPRSVKIGWITMSQIALALVAFYLGRATAPTPQLFDRGPSPLAHMPLEQLNLQLSNDLARLKIVARGLEELEPKSVVLYQALKTRRLAENRQRHTPAEDDMIRGQLMTYLAYRDVLLRMVATYAGFESVSDPEAQARCILMAHAAGSVLFEYSLKLVGLYGDDPIARAKLNEADARWGIPGGVFDRIHANLGDPRNSEALAEIGAYIDAHHQQWADARVLPPDDFQWLTQRVGQSAHEIKARNISPMRAHWDQIVARVRKDTYSPVYAAQSMVSTWIGDTRLVQWEPLIRIEQIKQMQQRLQPGDILLERRNWFLSNAFLPGFWPHSALYIGTPEELEKLGILRREGQRLVATDPHVRRHLDEYLRKAADGEAHTVLEAISDGVVFNSLTESMHADYVAVLRPRLTDKEKAEAIVRSFEHVGKPYDFEFDFATSDKLVCSELVYRAYSGRLNMDMCMQKIMGRETLPPLEIARKFSMERASANQQLDFVLFLDGVPSERAARLADEQTFCTTVTRPRGFNE